MNNKPLVCVCVPTYNASSTIIETLQSILRQSYENIIIKIIDNASTDDTVTKVKQFSDPRISIHINKNNIGGENNFTKCLEQSDGDYTCIYHADDVYNIEIIERQVKYLNENPKSGAVFSDAILINENGVKLGRQGNFGRVAGNGCTYNFSQIFKGLLKYSNFFICPSAMIRSEICQNEIKLWNGADYKTSADLDVWLRILINHEIGILPEALIKYRISRNQGSVHLRGRVERADMFLVIDHYFNLDEIKSILNDEDIRNYYRLDRTDRVVRAMNLYLQGDKNLANLLIQNFFELDSFVSAITSYRGMATFVGAAVVRGSIDYGMDKAGTFSIKFLKKISNR